MSQSGARFVAGYGEATGVDAGNAYAFPFRSPSPGLCGQARFWANTRVSRCGGSPVLHVPDHTSLRIPKKLETAYCP